MKIRNKKTGEIANIKDILTYEFIKDAYSKDYNYFKLKMDEVLEDWEDYEEPKEFWYIERDGIIFSDVDTITQDYANRLISIGNYFETEEEAEKAVEKLKAWNRLKDKGFKFQFWTSSYSGDSISFFIDWINADSKKEIEADLDLLFGGEHD